MQYDLSLWLILFFRHLTSVIFVNENENGEKRENNEFVNEN